MRKRDWLDFENSHRLFWLIFDFTIGFFLRKIVRKKTIKAIRRSLGKKRNGNNDAELLASARKVFDKNEKVPEIFDIRTKFFNADSPLLDHFCRYVATAHALDDVYNVNGSFLADGRAIFPQGGRPDLYSRFYLNCPDGQSVRNRYVIVAKLCLESKGGNILSIACGSAQPLIHAVKLLNDRKLPVRLYLTDASDESLSLAKKRVDDFGIADLVTYRKTGFIKVVKYFEPEYFDVIEACGIGDYLSDQLVSKLVENCLRLLKSKGKLIISNMAKTRAAKLLSDMYNWDIVYRRPDELAGLIKQVGGSDVAIYREPWGIHPVVSAVKP